MSEDIVRVYTRRRVSPAQESAATHHVKAVVEAAGKIPGTLQSEWFFSASKNELSVLESHDGVEGLSAYLENADRVKVAAALERVAPTTKACVLDTIPNELASAVSATGVALTVVDPWPGTLRLHEAKAGQPSVQSYVEMELSDLETYRAAVVRIEAAAANFPSVLYHRNFATGDNSVVVLEGYTDSDGLLAWATSEDFANAAGDLGSLITGIRVEVLGNIHPNAKEVMDAWGAIYYESVAGFSRFGDQARG